MLIALILFVYEGGITTLVDMPLNSFPSTVSEETLKLKVRKAYLLLALLILGASLLSQFHNPGELYYD